MRVLVDTSVWSLALRRAQPDSGPLVQELTELVREGRALIMGAIRQELLSGLKTDRQFETLRDHLRAFPDLELATADFELAARFYSRCKASGIQGSNSDFLLCAVASRRDLSVLTNDGDFGEYRRHVPVKLHEPREVKLHEPRA